MISIGCQHAAAEGVVAHRSFDAISEVFAELRTARVRVLSFVRVAAEAPAFNFDLGVFLKSLRLVSLLVYRPSDALTVFNSRRLRDRGPALAPLVPLG